MTIKKIKRELKFKDKKKLDAMLEFRRKNWSYFSLAFIYGVDHSSIYHLCKKYHVGKEGKDTVKFDPKVVLELLDIHAKHVKTYADYLKDAGITYKVSQRRLVDVLVD